MENNPINLEVAATDLRKRLKILAADTKLLSDATKVFPKDTKLNDGKADAGECIANFMLAYRHLEDASMRLGKVLQAWNGGESVYDKESTVGA